MYQLDWPVLLFSLILVSLDSLLSWITYFLPEQVLGVFDRFAHWVYSPTKSEDPITTKVRNAQDFVELCEIFGYKAEEHIVRTSDGYLLGVHRIGSRHDINKRGRQVVYLHHGLLMCSEVWVCNSNPQNSLPFILDELGYDVWLGNNRGNKYSKKHVSKHPANQDFWDFSMDDFAMFDIPDTIDYILEVTGRKSLAYVGFSQGSAQAFASLSINPQLNDKIRLFVALAPAMAPPGLNNRIVDTLMKATPQLIYLIFGKKQILKSTTFWQNVMYPPMFVKIIDYSLTFLFAWTGKNISHEQKIGCYAHLYSYTSVKSVVHWFQVMRAGKFNMFDDDNVISRTKVKNQFYKVAPFPTRNITTPIVLIYGKSDSLVDIDVMLKELPESTAYVGISGYEHLDMLWGDHVDQIFPYIISALSK